jgi:hypothetical protein
VLPVALQLNLAGVPEREIATFLVQLREEILERARELPGVEAAGMINVVPLHQYRTFSMEHTRAGCGPTRTRSAG